jgi:YHS domain-containing protein
MGSKVTEKSQTVVVNGRTYRICCPPCAQKLEKAPDKYLNPDGTVKTKKKK